MNETLTHTETLKAYAVVVPEKQKRRWSLHFESCVSCGTTQFKHSARGLCSYCYKIENKERENALRVIRYEKQIIKKRVNLEWQQRARYDRHKLGMTAKESLNYWPFDTRPSEAEWIELSKCN